jgi:hypothetical protein
MKMPNTAGPTVAISLAAGTVAVGTVGALAQSGAAPVRPTANAEDAAANLRVPADWRSIHGRHWALRTNHEASCTIPVPLTRRY